MTTPETVLVPVLLPRDTYPVRLAVAAYLARYKGQSRVHTESDLRSYLTWCHERDLDPLAAQRPHVELYIAGCRDPPLQAFDRQPPDRGRSRVLPTCAIDAVLEHSPAEYVRRERPGRIADARPDAPAVRGHARDRLPVR